MSLGGAQSAGSRPIYLPEYLGGNRMQSALNITREPLAIMQQRHQKNQILSILR